jgi:general secretion pathway protein H
MQWSKQMSLPAIGSDVARPDRDNGSLAGFTLIEIAVVMVIISMVMMLVLPRLPSSDQENLKISARTLASTLRYMQERAATSRTGYYLTLAPGTDSVKIVEIGGDGSAKEPTDPLLQKSPVKGGITVADVRIPRLGKVTEGELRVDVGVAGVRDFVTIHLRSAEGQFWTVMAFPSGGKVKAFEGYHEDPP